jgi:Protein of unknown function (DUF1360)
MAASETEQRPRVRPRAEDGAATQAARPLKGYAALSGLFLALAGGFATWLRRSGRELPEQVATRDLLLLTLATHKLSRLIAKDRVTSAVRAPFTSFQREGGPAEVEEEARGDGLKRAVGELLVCPYCVGLWIAFALAAGLVLAPRSTRWIGTVLTALLGSDVLQIAYKKLEDQLEPEGA